MNDKIFSPNPKDLIKVIDNLYSSMNNYNIEVINFISNLEKENIKRYKDILEKQGDKLNFNIFDIITDKWKKENFHSEILKFLLENYEEFFNNFSELIKIKDKKEYSNAEITNEEARIDILIKSENKAIIVENKINWAPDQIEQLARYYKKVKEEKEVEKIVYIAPSKDKNPDAQTFGEYEKEIKDRLEKIISFDGSENDLVSCLEKSRDKLKENLEKTKNNFDSENFHKLFFINHYIEILKRTGEGDMSTIKSNFSKEIIEKYKNGDNIFEKLNYIIEMCSDKNFPAKMLNDYFIFKFGMNDCGYDKDRNSYSCNYWLDYNNGKEKNAFSITIHSLGISEVYLILWDNNENINNILKTVINKKEAEYLIKQDLTNSGIKFIFPDEEDKLFDLVSKLKNAFDEFCNS
ncbi:PD-(D/E)XK nuclease family protein [Brachyspira aalborgi]|uniref:PD-(D/E)XK nuclease family protein n=1 Tax=Brachyspira aalborgi TaxID=29522 RepID=A0A5C8CGC5_9SPIR|nr:PD-(D/E)XK nuclease family protein [Brachyspira aalborgi]TXJ11976.1 hypothetical protein EPJ80_09785 [Brachyspira aalborgi]